MSGILEEEQWGSSFMQSIETSLFTANTCPCPVCRHGNLSNLAMMDSLACDLCNNIFTPDPKSQLLELEGSPMTVRWEWDGRHWRAPYGQGIGLGVKLAAAAFVILPTALMVFSVLRFRPVPGSPLSWFPYFWIGATLFCHFACVFSAFSSYYQFSPIAYLRALGKRFLSRGLSLS
jgi:hypothetical protein